MIQVYKDTYKVVIKNLKPEGYIQFVDKQNGKIDRLITSLEDHLKQKQQEKILIEKREIKRNKNELSRFDGILQQAETTDHLVLIFKN